MYVNDLLHNGGVNLVTIKKIANKVGVSTTTVHRVLNNSSKVKEETRDKVLKIAEELTEQEGKKNSRNKEITIKDVADLAGYSEATVSRVINQFDGVGEDTRTVVENAIKKLNYRVNINARNFRKSKTKLIGLLIPNILIAFYGNILKGIQNLAYENDYTVILLETNGEMKKELNSISFLKDRRADGMIYIGKSFIEQRVAALKSCNFPIIVFSGDYKENGFPTVKINNYQASYDMTEYLIKTGYTKIAFISGPLDEKIVGVKRLQGYKCAMKEYGLIINDQYILESDFSFEGGYRLVQQLLQQHILPDAIFAAGDEMAVGAMRAIQEKGLSIPQDIAVTGFDNIRLSRFVTPRLTTISQPIYELGQTAMQMLLDRITHKVSIKMEKVLDYQLIVRESS